VEKVKNLELWEQQNTNTELNFYAANLSAKIRSTVVKKENNSPRLNVYNLAMILKDPYGDPISHFQELPPEEKAIMLKKHQIDMVEA
jgi:hypothetical protein